MYNEKFDVVSKEMVGRYYLTEVTAEMDEFIVVQFCGMPIRGTMTKRLLCGELAVGDKVYFQVMSIDVGMNTVSGRCIKAAESARVSESMVGGRYEAYVNAVLEKCYIVTIIGEKIRGIVPKEYYEGDGNLTSGERIILSVTDIDKERNLVAGKCVKDDSYSYDDYDAKEDLLAKIMDQLSHMSVCGLEKVNTFLCWIADAQNDDDWDDDYYDDEDQEENSYDDCMECEDWSDKGL